MPTEQVSAEGRRQSPPPWPTAVVFALLFVSAAALSAIYFFEDARLQNPSQTAAAAAANPFADIALEADSVVVVDLATDHILYSRNPDVQLPLASLTKVPMAFVASEVLLPDAILTIPEHETPDGASIRLPAGLKFLARDLMDFTLVASSNEGAEIVASAARGGIKRKYPEADQNRTVLWRMNNLARNLGLTRTYFLNLSGLDLSTTQAGAYGSANDTARLFAYIASTSPHIFEQTSRNEVQIRALSGETIRAVNTDEALPSIPGLIMGKTGYTDLAGGNLAIVFEVGPARPVAIVVLHSSLQGRFDDVRKLVAATQAAIAAQ